MKTIIITILIIGYSTILNSQVPYREIDKWGFIEWNYTKDFEVIIEPQFDEAFFFQGEYARIRVNDKFGFIDKSGKLVVDTIYDYATDFYNGFASVWKNGSQKILNEQLELKYTYPYGFKTIKENKGLDYIVSSFIMPQDFNKKTFKKIKPEEIIYHHVYHSGKHGSANHLIYFVKKANKWGAYYGDELVIPIEYDSIYWIANTYYVTVKGNYKGLYEKNGVEFKKILNCEYELIETINYYNRMVFLAKYLKNGLWGYHYNYNTVTPKYKQIEKTSESKILKVVTTSGNYGYINYDTGEEYFLE